MSVFKTDSEAKRVIFNVRIDLAMRLEKAKEDARRLGKKLDVDSTVDKALEKFLKKAERKIQELEGREAGQPGYSGQPRPLEDVSDGAGDRALPADDSRDS